MSLPSSQSFARLGAWLVLLATLYASIQHVAAFFSLKPGGFAWVPALAVDGGLLVTTYSLTRRRNPWLVRGFWVFLLLSIFANLDYTLAYHLKGAVAWSNIWALDPWQIVKVAVISSPPLLTWMMTEVAVQLARNAEADDDATATQPRVAQPTQPRIARRNRHALKGPRAPVAQLTAGSATHATPNATSAPVEINPVAQPRAATSATLRAQPAPVAQPTQVADATNATTLSEVAREVVALYGTGLTHAEIGERMGFSPQASSKHLNQAREIAPAWTEAHIRKGRKAQARRRAEAEA